MWVTNTTPFGRRSFQMGDSAGWSPVNVEQLLNGSSTAMTDEEGRFQLRGLLDKTYDVAAIDPRTVMPGDGWRIEAGARAVELVLERDPDASPVTGRVVSIDGHPIPGLKISPQRRPSCRQDSSRAVRRSGELDRSADEF